MGEIKGVKISNSKIRINNIQFFLFNIFSDSEILTFEIPDAIVVGKSKTVDIKFFKQ